MSPVRESRTAIAAAAVGAALWATATFSLLSFPPAPPPPLQPGAEEQPSWGG